MGIHKQIWSASLTGRWFYIYIDSVTQEKWGEQGGTRKAARLGYSSFLPSVFTLKDEKERKNPAFLKYKIASK